MCSVKICKFFKNIWERLLLAFLRNIYQSLGGISYRQSDKLSPALPKKNFFEYHRYIYINRSSHPEVFLEKDVLKIAANLQNTCRNAISIKSQRNFTEITLRHRCSPVNLLHIFRIPFLKNTSGGLLLNRSYIVW